MHELAATEALLAVALEAAREAGGRRIGAIDVVVGELTSIVDDSVAFYFEILSRDTPAAGAQLRFRREPAVGRCQACGAEFPVTPPLVRWCPKCESADLRVEGGRAFYISSIEVDG